MVAARNQKARGTTRAPEPPARAPARRKRTPTHAPARQCARDRSTHAVRGAPRAFSRVALRPARHHVRHNDVSSRRWRALAAAWFRRRARRVDQASPGVFMRTCPFLFCHQYRVPTESMMRSSRCLSRSPPLASALRISPRFFLLFWPRESVTLRDDTHTALCLVLRPSS